MSVTRAISVRASRTSDHAAIRELLIDAALPIQDLDSAAGLRFWVAEDGGQLIGAIGLEPFGATGLLRSLVVSPSHRVHGLGSALVSVLEQEVSVQGVQTLVLLTETAEAFFRRRGYRVVERSVVPDEIKQSAEFRSLCPASAVCMTKSPLTTSEGVFDG
jgi:amino-acid N-acetyltransferase